MDGVKLVSSEVLGVAGETVIVGAKAYYLSPPTIRKIAGAGIYLSDLKGETLADMFRSMKDFGKAAAALSWFIQGDESLTEELSKGTLDEVITGLETAVMMLGIQNFQRLSTLSQNVGSLIAHTK